MRETFSIPYSAGNHVSSSPVIVMLEVVYLGVGAASPENNLGLPAVLVRHDNNLILLDVGEGTQERMLSAGLSPLKLSAVFISHPHGDHFFGLLGLLQYMALHGRTSKLVIVAPPGIEDFVRVADRVSGHKRAFNLEIVEAYDGLRLNIGSFKIRVFEVEHTRHSYGIRLELPLKPRVRLEMLEKLGVKPGPFIRELLKGKSIVIGGKRIEPSIVVVHEEPISIVYTGDTEPCESTISNAKGATLLIHEATFHSRDWSEAREKKHSTAYEAGLIACEANVGYLALFHFSARYAKNLEFLEEDARRAFRRVYAARPYTRHILL